VSSSQNISKDETGEDSPLEYQQLEHQLLGRGFIHSGAAAAGVKRTLARFPELPMEPQARLRLAQGKRHPTGKENFSDEDSFPSDPGSEHL
jgi:hypothetical protein